MEDIPQEVASVNDDEVEKGVQGVKKAKSQSLKHGLPNWTPLNSSVDVKYIKARGGESYSRIIPCFI